MPLAAAPPAATEPGDTAALESDLGTGTGTGFASSSTPDNPESSGMENEGPTPADDYISFVLGTPYAPGTGSVNVLENDLDDDTITVVGHTDPAHGTVDRSR